jgi:hypothetical protein
MTDKPILFSSPMIRALLSGTKTQTRRISKRQPAPPDNVVMPLSWWTNYVPGDSLWVRESCADEHPLAIQDDRYSQPGRAGIPGPPPVHYRTIYRVDGEPLQIWRPHDTLVHPYFTLNGPADDIAEKYPTVCSNYTRADGKGIHWTQARHMPRWASRLTLTVTDVRVQRLQDISEADARAEGVRQMREGGGAWVGREGPGKMVTPWLTAKEAFADLWETINGPGSWDANPWIVALTFDVRKGNIDG